MPINTSLGAESLLPDEVGQRLIQQMGEQSVAMQAAQVVNTDSHRFVVPVVTELPSASWVTEGSEISESDMSTRDEVIEFSKLGAITYVTSEARNDSSGEIINLAVQTLRNDLARKLDEAFFDTVGGNAPAGLADNENLNTISLSATEWENLDPFAQAISNGSEQTATVTSFVVNPQTAYELSVIKQTSDSNMPLLSPTANTATNMRIYGVPVLVSPYVPSGTAYAIPDTRTYVALNRAPEVAISDQVAFTSDRYALKGTLRVGFGFAHPSAVSVIELNQGS